MHKILHPVRSGTDRRPATGVILSLFYQYLQGSILNIFFSWGGSLDIDATKGFGPETISLGFIKPGIYFYHVNQYSGDTSNSNQLLASGAKVTLYTNDYQRLFVVGQDGYVKVSWSNICQKKNTK